MANIRKRGTSWQVQIRRRSHPPLCRTFQSKRDAEIWARMVEARLDRTGLPGDYRELKRLKLGDLLLRYRDQVTPRKRSAENETYRINKLLRHPIAAVSLSDLNSGLFSAYRDERLAEVGPQAVRHYLNLLGHVLKIARNDWSIPLDSNPVDRVKKPDLPHSRKRRLTPHELERLEEASSRGTNNYMLPLIWLALETGMRRGELLAIRWDHIDFEARLLEIPITKNGHPRTIPLSPKTITILEHQKAEEQDRVFPVSTNAVKLAWHRLITRSGIENLHFHDLRHEAISRFFEKGLSVPDVALISGPRDYRMLFRYTHLRAEDIVGKLE